METMFEKKTNDKLRNVENLNEVQRQLCQTSLKYLCKNVFLMNDWDRLHDDMLEWSYKNRNRRFKMFLMPRGHLKTSIITIGWTIQNILQDFENTILLSSAVWQNARTFLRAIKEYLTTKSFLPVIYGNFSSESSWTQDEIIINQRKNVEKTPTIDTAGIDKILTSQHYNIIRADDLVTRETCTTEGQIEKVISHIKDLIKLLNPSGTFDIIGTRWDDRDAYNYVTEELTNKSLGEDSFAIYKRAAIENKAVIFPKKFSFESLKTIKTQIGSYEFSCNYENEPTSPINRIFTPPVRYWDTLPETLANVVTVDPAISKKQDSCDAVVMDLSFTKQKQFYVNEYAIFKEEHKHPSNIITKILEYIIRFNAKTVGIESVGYQEALCYLLEDELEKRKLNVMVVPIKQIQDKALRIIALQVYWERGDILLKRGMVELEEQIDKFRKPITSKVDILDALSMVLQIESEYIKYCESKIKDAQDGYVISFNDRAKSGWNHEAYVPIIEDSSSELFYGNR